MATENLSGAAVAPLAAGRGNLAQELTDLQNELFDVHALLMAICARLYQFEEENDIDCNTNSELQRLIALAAREVQRLACDGAVKAAA